MQGLEIGSNKIIVQKMYKWKEVIEEKEKWIIAVIKGIETKSLKFTWSLKKKGKANYDKIDHKEIIKEEISSCWVTSGRNIKKKVFNVRLMI